MQFELDTKRYEYNVLIGFSLVPIERQKYLVKLNIVVYILNYIHKYIFQLAI